MPATPRDPRLVLAVALALPGMGHVLIGRAGRGLGFAAFTLLGAWLTTKLAPADASALGRHAGGLLAWALSIPDAYRSARRDREQAGAGGFALRDGA